ncbi:vWA domain-containing protein [Streptomyces mangrovisoli]|uniref:Magnesium chelatase n=1 Tax=Streptomyces mangrovisoli TaxID=1428628 RepID=A0A1J4NKF6_9ACTN|nr:vWA domain-containing protein [Streptomyces mangrovisoli]OIJ62791.1 magnesium chelatase [Streptomyces mangrovisoli]
MPTARARSLARSWAVVLVAAVLVLLPATATAAPSGDSPTRAQIYDSLGLGDLPADYVILVDTSGSMAKDGRYDTVRSTLRTFLDHVSRKDRVALFTFDAHPQLRYEGPAGGSGTTDRILAQLPAAPTPGAETDIGAALDAAVTELERADVSSISSVVLVTDGEHNPPAGSSYPSAKGAPWTALHKRAEAVARHTDLAGYALPLGSQASGADLMRSVVTPTTVLRPTSIDDLSTYLQRAGDRTRLRKAARLLNPDVGKGVVLSWSGSGPLAMTDGVARTTLTLTSRSRHVPLVVTGLHVSLTGPDATVTGVPDRVELAPGTSRTFRVTVRGHVGADPLPVRRTRHVDARLRADGKVGTDWAAVLRPDIDLRVPARVATGAPVPMAATVGSPLTLPLTIALLVALSLLGWLLWRRTHRPQLRGELVLWPTFGGLTSDRIALRGRRMTVRPRTIGGTGRIRGRRSAGPGGPRVDLFIRYTPDGTHARESNALCPPGEQVVINGISFAYTPGFPANGSR